MPPKRYLKLRLAPPLPEDLVKVSMARIEGQAVAQRALLDLVVGHHPHFRSRHQGPDLEQSRCRGSEHNHRTKETAKSLGHHAIRNQASDRTKVEESQDWPGGCGRSSRFGFARERRDSADRRGDDGERCS